MTQAYFFLDGKKVLVPMTPYEAVIYGWHQGAKYETALNWKEHDFDSIFEWCKATFDPHTYKMFMRSVWFLHEKDAVLCMLRWA